MCEYETVNNFEVRGMSVGLVPRTFLGGMVNGWFPILGRLVENVQP